MTQPFLRSCVLLTAIAVFTACGNGTKVASDAGRTVTNGSEPRGVQSSSGNSGSENSVASNSPMNAMAGKYNQGLLNTLPTDVAMGLIQSHSMVALGEFRLDGGDAVAGSAAQTPTSVAVTYSQFVRLVAKGDYEYLARIGQAELQEKLTALLVVIGINKKADRSSQADADNSAALELLAALVANHPGSEGPLKEAKIPDAIAPNASNHENKSVDTDGVPAL